MDTSLLEKIGSQIPSLTVLVILVVFFLKHISRSETSFTSVMDRIHNESTEHQKIIQSESLEARKRSQEVIELNTKVLAENNVINQSQTKALERLADVLTRDLFNLRERERTEEQKRKG